MVCYENNASETAIKPEIVVHRINFKNHMSETRNITGRVELFFPDLLWYFEAA